VSHAPGECPCPCVDYHRMYVPFMDVYLFSLVLAKGGCIIGFWPRFIYVNLFLAVYLLDLLMPPLCMWYTQVKAEWLYRMSA
jgi:hypothetical protein